MVDKCEAVKRENHNHRSLSKTAQTVARVRQQTEKMGNLHTI